MKKPTRKKQEAINWLVGVLSVPATQAYTIARQKGLDRPCVTAISGEGMEFDISAVNLAEYPGEFTPDEADGLASVPEGHFPLVIQFECGTAVIAHLPRPEQN